MQKCVKIKTFVELFCHTKNILEFNQYMKSDKMLCIIYADIESLIKITDDAQTIQKNLQQQK